MQFLAIPCYGYVMLKGRIYVDVDVDRVDDYISFYCLGESVCNSLLLGREMNASNTNPDSNSEAIGIATV